MDTALSEKNESSIEWLEAMVFALVTVIFLFTFIFRIVTVSGVSMVPTLMDNDRIAIQSMGYTPSFGDIVVVDGLIDYGDPIVKRVIGTSGDVIDIDFSTGTVTRNGLKLTENYISASTTQKYDVNFPITVPQGMIFVLGDNRPYSKDSRDSEIGMVDTRDVLGKAIFRIFPINTIGILE